MIAKLERALGEKTQVNSEISEEKSGFETESSNWGIKRNLFLDTGAFINENKQYCENFFFKNSSNLESIHYENKHLLAGTSYENCSTNDEINCHFFLCFCCLYNHIILSSLAAYGIDSIRGIKWIRVNSKRFVWAFAHWIR